MTDAKDRLVHVTYRRQVSDGNYGTESAEAYLEWHIDGDDDANADQECASEMLRQCHDIVQTQLRQSLNSSVQRAVAPRTTKATRGTAMSAPPDDEDLTELPF